ncbi:nuclear transport factor 2 family protein [Marinomonas pollencensis]|uniref:Putative SnoaL-like aldol condensation-catalyzing enzyme n=1 Tax=Marinomonas pollencensis TaxID=491954 RepID=A0A3E0DN50_9GAMM|nr:nuclear transport factor 2 family protein [Marinomonas pollencensis]REG83231.1 putative SnoaL-like aldol condensation-catalyzing enzyme [Marinomonas pollencensis]
MKATLLATLIVSSALLSACTTTTGSNLDATKALTNKEKAVAVLNSIESGNPKAISYINSTNYTQHNLAVGDGLAGFGEVLQALPKGSAKVDVVRAFEDGNYVFTQTDYNFFGPKVGFDVFRFDNGKIVEHWDNLTVKADKPNPSGHSQLDGSLVITDIDKTAANKALVSDFVNTVLVKGEYQKMSQFFDGDSYIQHNSEIGDGLSGLAKAIDEMAKHGVNMTFSKVHKVLGEGNFVLTISEGEFAGKATSYYDLFRVENGKIAEHWDVVETILPNSEWKNTNGKFGNL